MMKQEKTTPKEDGDLAVEIAKIYEELVARDGKKPDNMMYVMLTNELIKKNKHITMLEVMKRFEIPK